MTAQRTPKEMEPGWAHSPRGFTILQNGRTIQTASCQETTGMGEDAQPLACGKRARYARTLWSGGVIFACGRHRRSTESLARPVVAQGMGAEGYRAVVMRPLITGAPDHRQVPGAAEPVEHPVHIALILQEGEEPACWCGALPGQNGNGLTRWEGGKQLDAPWWERNREELHTEAGT